LIAVCVDDDIRPRIFASTDESTSIAEQSNHQKAKGNNHSTLQPAISTVSMAKLIVGNSYDNCRREGENINKRLVNNVKSLSSVPEDGSFENCHWSETQSKMPVCVSGIYGLLSSSRENTAAHQHNGSKNSQDKNQGNCSVVNVCMSKGIYSNCQPIPFL
jgi:hypothetical protein